MRINIISLVVALAALAVALFGVLHMPDESEIRRQVYGEIVQEAYEELVPVYKEFGIEAQRPQSIAEIIRPLIALEPNITKSK